MSDFEDLGLQMKTTRSLGLEQQMLGRGLRGAQEDVEFPYVVEDGRSIDQMLDEAVGLVPATPGRPEDGPYPGTVDEAADEVLAWLREMDQTSARGIAYAVLVKLGDSFDPESTTEDEQAQLVAEAIRCADSGQCTHWPTAAGYLADEVRRLRRLR